MSVDIENLALRIAPARLIVLAKVSLAIELKMKILGSFLLSRLEEMEYAKAREVFKGNAMAGSGRTRST